MQMPEYAQGDAARRPLGRLGKHQLAQLRKHRSRQPQQAIGQQQAHRHHQQGLCAPRLHIHRVHQLLQQQRHTDIRQLSPDHQQQGQQHPPAVLPQIGDQALEGIPVIALHRPHRSPLLIPSSRHSPHVHHSLHVLPAITIPASIA